MTSMKEEEMRDDMVRDVHDTEEVQGDIFLDDGKVISKTNMMKPSPVVTVTRSEETSAESVGYRVKDAKSRKNESPSPSLLPPPRCHLIQRRHSYT